MESSRKGGCLLVPRYGPGAGGQAPPGMSWQMGKIMLKFRPIAPKPAAMAPAPAPALVAAATRAGRGGKRKAVDNGGRRGRKPKKAAATTVAPASSVVAPAPAAVVEKESDDKEKSLSSRSSSSSAMTSVDSSPPTSPPPPPASSQPPPATLPLMPVSPVAEEKAVVEAPARATPAPPEAPARAQQAPVAPRPTTPSCCITVEDVTSTWRDGEALPSAAAAAASACGADDGAAPAFVSDQWGRITWSNAAFTRAVSSDDGGSSSSSSGEGGAVALAGALPAWGTCAGFTCRVRVRRAVARRAGGWSVVAPCDVWRLDASGCYLWRLDLQAALTLGGLP